jgi:hypothetical protein
MPKGLSSYTQMSERDLHNALSKRYDSPEAVELVKEQVREMRKNLKAQRAHKRQLDHTWGEFIAPLMHERKVVRSMLGYKAAKSGDARTLALQAYIQVLDTLRGKLELLKREKSQTPMQLNPERTHWCDHVPQHIKDRVVALFDAIPPVVRAKRKRPFERTVPVILHNKQRDRLLRRTTKDLGRAQSEGDEALTKQISQALDTIKRLPMGEPVPTTWHGL